MAEQYPSYVSVVRRPVKHPPKPPRNPFTVRR